MAGNQGRTNHQRLKLVVGDNWLGSIETRSSPKQIIMLWDFWKEELASPDSNGQFHDWLVQSGFAKDCRDGEKLELSLS